MPRDEPAGFRGAPSTNFDAAHQKYVLRQLGYTSDAFQEHFFRAIPGKYAKRDRIGSPLLNRGYFLRMYLVHTLVYRFGSISGRRAAELVTAGDDDGAATAVPDTWKHQHLPGEALARRLKPQFSPACTQIQLSSPLSKGRGTQVPPMPRESLLWTDVRVLHRGMPRALDQFGLRVAEVAQFRWFQVPPSLWPPPFLSELAAIQPPPAFSSVAPAPSALPEGTPRTGLFLAGQTAPHASSASAGQREGLPHATASLASTASSRTDGSDEDTRLDDAPKPKPAKRSPTTTTQPALDPSTIPQLEGVVVGTGPGGAAKVEAAGHTPDRTWLADTDGHGSGSGHLRDLFPTSPRCVDKDNAKVPKLAKMPFGSRGANPANPMAGRTLGSARLRSSGPGSARDSAPWSGRRAGMVAMPRGRSSVAYGPLKRLGQSVPAGLLGAAHSHMTEPSPLTALSPRLRNAATDAVPKAMLPPLPADRQVAVAPFQIINLGAGFDTLWFLMRQQGWIPAMHVDVDILEMQKLKLKEIVQSCGAFQLDQSEIRGSDGTRPLCATSPTKEGPVPDQGSPEKPSTKARLPSLGSRGLKATAKINPARGTGVAVKVGTAAEPWVHVTPTYALLGADLAESPAQLLRQLCGCGIDPSLPVLLLAECVLSYIDPAKVDALLSVLANAFPCSACVVYDPIKPDDAFGKMMAHNLRARGIALPGVEAYPTLQSTVTRLRTAGFSHHAAGTTILDAYSQALMPNQVDILGHLEPLDELEEWSLLLSHYCIAWGCRDEAAAYWSDLWPQLLTISSLPESKPVLGLPTQGVPHPVSDKPNTQMAKILLDTERVLSALFQQ